MNRAPIQEPREVASVVFLKGKHATVAVKVIDPRGNQLMKVVGI